MHARSSRNATGPEGLALPAGTARILGVAGSGSETRNKRPADLIHEALNSGKVLSITAHSYNHREREQVDMILGRYLEEGKMTDLHSLIAYCLHELAGNARKANIKRLYYQMRGLDMANDSDYQAGLEGFKQVATTDDAEWSERMREAGMYIRFQFLRDHEKITAVVRNNAPLLPVERSRIAEKLREATQYKNMAEAYEHVRDFTEGAGLGLTMVVIMLRNLGLSDRTLQIYATEKETIAHITLPLYLASQEMDAAG